MSKTQLTIISALVLTIAILIYALIHRARSPQIFSLWVVHKESVNITTKRLTP